MDGLQAQLHPDRLNFVEGREHLDHRLTGDAPKRLLIAPKWSANKRLVLNTLRAKIARA